MAALTINGIALPVLAGTGKREPLEVGERGTADDGTAWSSIRTTKQRWLAFRTPPLVLSESRAWERLLRGEGHTADFEVDLYTAQGVPASVTGTPTASTLQKKFGNRSLRLPAGGGTSTCIWALGLPSNSWTVGLWQYIDGAWQHVVVNSAGGVWANGGPSGIATNWMAVNGVGNLRLRSIAGQDTFYDDLLALPFVVPATWPAGLYGLGSALPALPRLSAGGDLINGGPLTVLGRPAATEPLQAVLAGTFQAAERLEFDLAEG